MKHRLVIRTQGKLQNFLKIQETSAGDVIVSPRGIRHVIGLDTISPNSYQLDKNQQQILNITIHPNLNAKIGSITINYKIKIGNNPEEKQIAGLLDVKNGNRFFPIITSIGRNIAKPSLTKEKYDKSDKVINILEDGEIDLTTNTLAYTLIVGNPNISCKFPDDFPRNIIQLEFTHFQIFFLYWYLPLPTKFRGSSLFITTNSDKYPQGMEFHEVLNFTNDVTLNHMEIYDTLPK